ncbi:type II toxin-antitoxin system CcdA family antitoxin [Thermococcus peptonophilus]|uniref:type II toxin-antitoxin system CcdA family antitoxin n=1 Tax=Thermococcus peptonophilus TaxID=53952 RepID=UPI0034672E8A
MGSCTGNCTCICKGSVQKRAVTKNVTLRIRADLVEFAKREGINMSRLLEEALNAFYSGRRVILGPGAGI